MSPSQIGVDGKSSSGSLEHSSKPLQRFLMQTLHPSHPWPKASHINCLRLRRLITARSLTLNLDLPLKAIHLCQILIQQHPHYVSRRLGRLASSSRAAREVWIPQVNCPLQSECSIQSYLQVDLL